jgi:nucleoid-associated protein YgaU
MLGAARWLVGATLLVGPLTSGVAAAAQPGEATAPPASAAAVLSLDRPLTPNLDRPLAPAAIGGTPATAAGIPMGSAPAASQLPASQLPASQLAASQLATSQLPASQTPTAAAPARALPTLPAVPATSRAAAQLLTGTAHRDNANVIANANANANAARTAGRDYVVRPGDTLWDIAARHLGPNASNADIARAWPRWYAANRVSIGANPQLIHPGLVLQPPSD